MTIVYGYEFTHNFKVVPIQYNFSVYRVYTSVSCDFICEFVGLEALNHYEIVKNATPEQLQQYLFGLFKQEYIKRQASLAMTRALANTACTKAFAMCLQARALCNQAQFVRTQARATLRTVI